MNRGATLILTTLAALAGASIFACQWQWGEDGLARLEQLNAGEGGAPETGAGSSSGSGAGSSSGASSTCPLPDDADAGAAPAPSTSCLGLINGQFAVRLVQFESVTTLQKDNLTITDLFLAQPSADASSLELTFCGEESALTNAATGQPDMLGANSVPSLLVNALAATPLPLPLPADGTIHANAVVWLWGLRNLANPSTDPLPTSADAGTVWDQDMDGKPGVTVDVLLPQGEIYLVKRAVFDFAPSTYANGWYAGSLQVTSSQEIVGASTTGLETSAPITPQSGCTSVYQLKCVDPTFSCASLVAGYETLFVGAPTPTSP